mgnify:CR=1 FL=1
MKNIKILSILFLVWCFGNVQAADLEDRKVFISHLTKIADPVLINLSQDKLKENMPVEKAPNAYGATITYDLALKHADKSTRDNISSEVAQTRQLLEGVQ